MDKNNMMYCKKHCFKYFKTTRIITAIFLVFSICVTCGIEVCASDVERVITVAYEYPVIPGTPEWKSLPSVVERREVSNVPVDVLEKMTTEALVETVINYPFLSDIYAFDTIYKGIDWISQYYNGIAELKKRDDAVYYLEQYYDKTQERYDYLSGVSCENRTYDMCIEMVHHESAKHLVEYLEYIAFENDNEENLRYTEDVVHTPHNTSVPVIYGYNWADHGMTASDAYNEMISQLQNYPSAYQVPGFGVNPVYNCHSYAWDLGNCWMYDPSAYITDGSYIGTYPIVNCKVTYTNSAYNSVLPIIHSGVVTLAGTTPSNIYVVSKWGYGGLISHTVLDCPYYQPYVLFNQTTSSISYWKINQ